MLIAFSPGFSSRVNELPFSPVAPPEHKPGFAGPIDFSSRIQHDGSCQRRKRRRTSEWRMEHHAELKSENAFIYFTNRVNENNP